MIILERDRDEKGKLTHWLAGRRIIYVSVPREPLPKFIQVGPFKTSVYHREQRTFCAKRLLTAETVYKKDNTRRPTVLTQSSAGNASLTDTEPVTTSVRLFQK